MVRKLIYSALLLFFCITLCRSQTYILQYTGNDQSLQLIEKFQPLQQSVTDSLSAWGKINELLSGFYTEGYLTAHSQPLKKIDSTFYAFVESGEQYQWAQLESGNVPELLLSKTGFRERFFIDKPFKYQEAAKLFKRIIKQSENTGYPFASIEMDSVTISGDDIHATLHYISGPFITYDSISIEGTTKVKRDWLASYLGIRQGAAFDQSTVDRIGSRINDLSFVEMAGPLQITFQNSEATVKIMLKDVSANRVDGIIGFLPNAKNDGSLLVTGQFDLGLANLFNTGKHLAVEWQRLKPLSQFLYIKYDHPNLLRSPLRLGASFELLKEDTTFINRNALISFSYKKSVHDFSFFSQLKNSRLLSTEPFKEATTLPDISDFNINYYGVGYSFSAFKGLRVKRGGMGAAVEVAVGTKKIRKNLALPAEVYDDVDLNSVQYQLKAIYEYYVPISRQLVFYQKLAGAKIFNDQLFLNDLFRVGGLRSLRGFNENFFYASEFLLTNLELRLLYDADSWLFIFYDQSYLYFNTGESRLDDYPLGLGAGINFSTKAGVVSLAYALGQSEGQPLSLRLSKFHFGYIAKF